MIKAIIFDFFGVLAVRGSISFRQQYYADDAKKIAQEADLIGQLGLGKVGYDDFIDGLARLGGVDRETVLKYTEDYQPNLELLDYIRSRLKSNYKIGIISNAGADWVHRILGDTNYKLFDDVVLSYKYSVIKPQPEIYQISAKNLGVRESECIFIDDISIYCDGAEAAGMESIWYQDFRKMKAELERLLSAGTDN